MTHTNNFNFFDVSLTFYNNRPQRAHPWSDTKALKIQLTFISTPTTAAAAAAEDDDDNDDDNVYFVATTICSFFTYKTFSQQQQQ